MYNPYKMCRNSAVSINTKCVTYIFKMCKVKCKLEFELAIVKCFAKAIVFIQRVKYIKGDERVICFKLRGTSVGVTNA